MKKFICLILGAVIVFCMTGWTTGDIWSPASYTENYPEESKTPAANALIASNDKFELKWDGTNMAVYLTEKGTSNRWGVVPELSSDGAAANNPLGIVMTSDEIASACIVQVLDTVSNADDTFARSTTSAVKNEKGRVVTEEIENGIRVKYFLNDVKIMIPMEFVLREDSVAVSVNSEQILEDDRFKAVAVKICPFWCSANNDKEDSYLFIPSGSGALVDTKTIDDGGVEFMTPLYGYDPVMARTDLINTTKEARIPVFGAKEGNLGTCAIIENASEAAYIGTKTGSSTLMASGVYASFQLRDYASNYMQQMQWKLLTDVYAHSTTKATMTVGFYPLSGDKANYSGMAEVYKDYLDKNGQLGEVTEDSPLNVTFVGGVMIDRSFMGVPYKDLIAATTIGDAQNILGELSKETGAKMSAKLLGFGSTGVEYNSYAGGMKINSNIGSPADLSKLSDFAKGNNIDLYYDFDLIKLKKDSGGFSTFFDTAYSATLKVTTAYSYNPATRNTLAATGYKLLTRTQLQNGANKVMSKIKNWNLPGVGLDSLTSTAYSDHSTQTTEYMVKGNMGRDVTAIVKSFHDAGYKVSAFDANAYAALAADIVYSAPTESAKQKIFIEDVPFYQMVFKGYVPMASESINTAINSEEQVLKNIEGGVGLGYTLIKNYENEFIEYPGYYFFGSNYADVKDSIIETYAELKDYYAAINKATIVDHNILGEGFRETVFSNGVKVYVNYTDEDVTAPNGKTVSANGYYFGKE